jgi:hypothetical protein
MALFLVSSEAWPSNNQNFRLDASTDNKKNNNTWFSRLRSLSHDSATDSVAAQKQS